MPPSRTRTDLAISPLQTEEDARACARRLYERLGYKVIGELTDSIVRGHSEFLLRKTLGPLTGFGSKVPPGRTRQGSG